MLTTFGFDILHFLHPNKIPGAGSDFSHLGSGAAHMGRTLLQGTVVVEFPKEENVPERNTGADQQNNMLTIPCSTQWAAIGLFEEEK